jgi:hypothetical protein
LARASVQIDRLPVAEVTPSQWDEIWRLGERFTDTTRAHFEDDVRRKDEVVLVREGARGELLGLATVHTYATRYAGRKVWVIYAGNTLLDPRLRGFNVFHKVGFESFLRVRLRNPLAPIYFFFDTYSYKSYLMLARNFGEYWPRRDAEMPADVAAFIDQLGRERYGKLWDPERRLCRGTGEKKLKPWVAEITPADLAIPEIRFYVEQNPGYREGDMLAALAPLSLPNWIALAGNMLRRARGARSTPARRPT